MAWGTSLRGHDPARTARPSGWPTRASSSSPTSTQQVAEAVAEHPELDGQERRCSPTSTPTTSARSASTRTHDTRAGLPDRASAWRTPAVVDEASAETDEFYVTTQRRGRRRASTTSTSSSPTATPTARSSQIQADPLLAQIPAIERGSVAVLEDSTPLAASANPSPLSIAVGHRRVPRPPRGCGRPGRVTDAPPPREAVDAVTPPAAAPARARLGSWLAGRPGRRCRWSCVASVAFGARVVGWHDIARRPRPATRTRIAQAAVAKRVPAHGAGACSSAPRSALVGRGDAGRHPQPARRPGHPRRRPPAPRWPSSSASRSSGCPRRRRTSGSPSPAPRVVGGRSSTRSARSGAAARPRSSSPSPVRPPSAAFSSLISAILLPRDRRHGRRSGSGRSAASAARRLDKIAQVLPFLAVGALICLATARGLNSLALGDDVAAGLGERVAHDPAARRGRGGHALRRGHRGRRPDRVRRPGRAAPVPAARRHRPPLAAAVLGARRRRAADRRRRRRAGRRPPRARSTSASSPRSSAPRSSSASSAGRRCVPCERPRPSTATAAGVARAPTPAPRGVRVVALAGRALVVRCSSSA